MPSGRTLPGESFVGVRQGLFFGAGLSLPLAEFPLFRFAGKGVDLALVLAVLFVLASAPAFLAGTARLPIRWLAMASGLPLLALLRPEPPFSGRQFAFSYAHWGLVILVFSAAWLLPCRKEALRRFLLLQAAMVAVVAAFALYQVIGIPKGWPLTGAVISSWQGEPFRLSIEGSFVRPTSVFPEPSWLGAYLAWAIVCALTAVLSSLQRGAGRVLLLASTFLAAAALATTVSWGGYADGAVALGGVAGAAAWTLDRRARRQVLASLAAFLSLSGLLVALVAGGRLKEAVKTRVGELRQTSLFGENARGIVVDSARSRLDNAKDALTLFRRRPLAGVGLGQFGQFQNSVLGRSSDISSPWTGWLAVAAETGFLGPVVLLGAVALPLRSGWRHADPFARLFVPAAAALLIVQQVHMATYISLFWWLPVAFLATAAPGDGALTEERGPSSLPRPGAGQAA